MNSVQSDFSDEPRSSSGSSGDYKPAGNNAKRKPPAVPRKPDKGKANGIIEKVARYEFLHCNNSQHHPTPHPTVVSPKVFRADSVTVNAPAKDVLGTRVVENLMKYAGNGANTYAKNTAYDNVTRGIVHDNNNRIDEPYLNVSISEPKTQDSSNNVIVNSVRAFQSDNKNINLQQQNTNLRIKTPSPSFNRNPQNVALKHTVQQRAEETLHMEGRRKQVDMEEALLNAEYDAETTLLTSVEQEKTLLLEKIRELETNREKVKHEQDVIQIASSEKVWKAKEAVHRIELDLKDNPRAGLLVDLKQAQDALENEKKIYEDLEFQYLEEEADWLAQKEELHNKVVSLSQKIDEKKSKLKQLETQKSEVFNSTCKQTRVLEQNQLESIRQLELKRNVLKGIEYSLRVIGIDIKCVPNQSDAESEDELLDNEISIRNRSMASLDQWVEYSKSRANQDLMTTSMNDNILRSHIESGRLDSGYTSPKTLNDAVRNASEELKKLPKNSNNKSELEKQNGVVMYNCNNIPKEKSSNINNDKTKDKSFNYSSLNSDVKLSKQFELFSPECLDLIKSKNPPASLMTRVPSQDDIDRISKVTSKSPICTANGGSKAAESLRQIEKNRQILLHMKGSQVIESARQRVSELKLRAQSEVRAKWEETHPNTDNDFVNSDLTNTPDLIPTNKNAAEKMDQVETDMKKLNVNGESDKSEFVKSGDAKRDGGSVIKRMPKLELIEDLCKDRGYSLSSIGSQHSIEGELDGISNESGRDSTQLQTPKEVSDTSLSDSRSPTDSGQLCTSSSGCDHSDSLLHLRPLSGGSDLSSCDTAGSAAAMMMVPLHPPPQAAHSGCAKLPKSQRPLTRYLPITSDHLDLREHMHAAGHMLETCPHVRVDALSCRGYLQKLCMNKWNLSGWGKRWFVFDRSQRTLVYYTDKHERKPRGGAYFQAIAEVYMDHQNAAHNGFIVKTHQREYRLTAPSSQAARIWIEAITTGAMGNLAYNV